MKELYDYRITKEQFEDILHTYFDEHKTGTLVRLTWIIKNHCDYLWSFLKENYPQYSYNSNILKYIYDIKFPDCKKICDVCGKPLDGFSLKKGYYPGFSHRSCNKRWATIELHSIDDIFDKKFSSSECDNLSKKEEIINLLSSFKLKFPQFSHYYNLKDLLIVVSRMHSYNDIDSVPRCKYCGKLCKPKFKHFSEYDSIEYSEFCYDTICINKQKMDSMVKTLNEKYGVSNCSQIDFVKEEKKKTSLLHYGVDNVFKSKEVREIHKKNLLEKYGVDNISKLDEIKKKKENTLLSHFGTMKEYIDYSFGSFCKKIGVHNVSQLDCVKEKKAETFFKHYGKCNCFQDEEIKRNIKKYWEENPEKFKIAVAKSTINMWASKKDIKNSRKLLTGIEECEILNEIQLILNVTIYRQVSCMQYYIDGYIYDYNIAIEYDEPDGHTNKKDVDYDIMRQKEIVDYIGCIFIRIKQIDWYMNKDKCIENIKNMFSVSDKLNLKSKVIMSQNCNSSYRVKKVILEELNEN